MVTYSASFLAFLKDSKSKVAQTLYKAHEHNYPSYRLMLTTAEINCLTLRPDGNISYLPAGREGKYNADGEWSREGRQAGRPAKVIRKLFTKKALALIKDKHFESFANSYKSKTSDDYSFQLWRNDRIPSVYDMTIAAGGGTLAESCMNDRGDQMDIYRCCKSLRMLVLLDDRDRLCGRSLIWSLEAGITLMDRVYVVSDFMYDLFISYAVEHAWWHKKDYRSADDKDLFVNQEGEEVRRKFKVTTSTDFDSYPYIDTFTYGGRGSLNNYGDGRYQYTNTDGSRYGDAWDEIAGCTIDHDDVIEITHGRRIGRNTHVDNTVEINEEIWWVDDPGIAVVHGSYYHLDETVLCAYDGERRLKSDCVWSDSLASHVPKSDLQMLEQEIDHTPALNQQQRA